MRYGDGMDRMNWRLELNFVLIECDEDQMMEIVNVVGLVFGGDEDEMMGAVCINVGHYAMLGDVA